MHLRVYQFPNIEERSYPAKIYNAPTVAFEIVVRLTAAERVEKERESRALAPYGL